MALNPNKQRCEARTRRGGQCASWARKGSERPRCSVHDVRPSSESGKRRCKAETRRGARCLNAAMDGGELCSVHARRVLPGEEDRAAGRVCSARQRKGKRCRYWAVPGSEPPLCSVHAGNYAAEGPARRRCEATTRRGRRCRGWAIRGAQGRALCSVHAGRYRLPEEGERRCTATTAAGERCKQWAIRGTAAQYGALLCAVHVPEGDPRKIFKRFPAVGARRCRATTLEGERCPRWVSHAEEADGMCWMHAFPNDLPQIKHGYYRRLLHFSDVAHAAIRSLAEEGEPLAPDLAIVRLKLRNALLYTGRPDISSADMNRAAYVIYRGAMAVSRLVRSQRNLHKIRWGPTSGGYAPELLEKILQLYPGAPPSEEDAEPN